MAILIDTSVWIDFFRGNETSQVLRLEEYIRENERLLTGDLILTELLQGIRTSQELNAVSSAFEAFLVVELVGETTARQSAAFYRHLRENGITVRKTIDGLIATWCILNQVPLLHADRDFRHYVSLGLVEA